MNVWNMTEAEVLVFTAALGHDLRPDHCSVTRFTCSRRECSRAVLNAGGGWYGTATTEPCARPVLTLNVH